MKFFMPAHLKHTNSCCSEHFLLVRKLEDANGVSICGYV